MTRILTAVAVSTAILASGPAFAGDEALDGLYATFFAGGALPATNVTFYETIYPVGITYDIGFGTGLVVGGAVGTTVLDNLRGEVEFSVMNSNIDEILGMPLDDTVGSVDFALIGNLWYDVHTGTQFSPYVGGGLGFGFGTVTIDSLDGDVHTSGFIYQLGGGVRFAATEDISLDLGYRYRVQPDLRIDASEVVTLDPDMSYDAQADSHVVQAGVSLNF